MRFHYRSTRRLEEEDKASRGSLGLHGEQTSEETAKEHRRHSFIGCCQACLLCIPSSNRFARGCKGHDQNDERGSLPDNSKSTPRQPPPTTPSCQTTKSTPYNSPASTTAPSTSPSRDPGPKSLLDSTVKGRNIESSFTAVLSSSKKASTTDRSPPPNRDITPSKVVPHFQVKDSNLEPPATVTPISHSRASVASSFDNPNSSCSSSEIESSVGDRSFRSLLDYIMEGSTSSDDDEGAETGHSSSRPATDTSEWRMIRGNSAQPQNDEDELSHPLQLPSLLTPYYEADSNPPTTTSSFQSAKEYLMDLSAAERDSASAVCSGDVPLWYHPTEISEELSQEAKVPPQVSFLVPSTGSQHQRIQSSTHLGHNLPSEARRQASEDLVERPQLDDGRASITFPHPPETVHGPAYQDRISPVSFPSMDSGSSDLPPTYSSSSSSKIPSEGSSSSSRGESHNDIPEQTGSMITGVVTDAPPETTTVSDMGTSPRRYDPLLADVLTYRNFPQVVVHVVDPAASRDDDDGDDDDGQPSKRKQQRRLQATASTRRRRWMGILSLALVLLVLLGSWRKRPIGWRFWKSPPNATTTSSSGGSMIVQDDVFKSPPRPDDSGMEGPNAVTRTVETTVVRAASSEQKITTSSSSSSDLKKNGTTLALKNNSNKASATKSSDCPCCPPIAEAEDDPRTTHQSSSSISSSSTWMVSTPESHRVLSSEPLKTSLASFTTTSVQYRYHWWWLTPSSQWERAHDHQKENKKNGRRQRQRQTQTKKNPLRSLLTGFLLRWRRAFQCIAQCRRALSKSLPYIEEERLT
jgi:hypothetical protein